MKSSSILATSRYVRNRIMRVGVYLLVAFLPHATSAAIPADFVGNWVVTADGKNVFVFDIAVDRVSQSLGGSMWRPRLIRITPPLLIEAVTLPVVKLELLDVRVGASGLRFRATRPMDPKESDTYEIALSEKPGKAMLTIVGLPQGPMTLSRTVKLETVAEIWESGKTFAIDNAVESSVEMLAIFNTDQEARKDMAKIDWSVVSRQDAARRDATRKLLDANRLQTGEDFLQAAFVFQHGNTSADYLFAHTLAMVAVAKGDQRALWIGTATLDRYLQSIGQPQIYGTQFKMDIGDTKMTQGDFDSALIPDALRAQLGVPILAQQEEQRKTLEAKAIPKSN